MHLGLLRGAIRTEHIPERLSIIHLAERIDMVREGKRIDLGTYVSIAVAVWVWGKRDLRRRPAPPRFRGEVFHSLP